MYQKRSRHRKEKPERNNGQRIREVFRLIADAIMTVVTSAACLIIAACLYMAVREHATGKMTFAFGYKPVIIESGSMEPVIQTGACVLLKQADYSEINEGDIITFYTDRGYVTHRLVGIDERAFRKGEDAFLITKGDANQIEDQERLAPGQIRGRVTHILNPL